MQASALLNPQLQRLVNHNASGTTNGLMGGCLPMGRYQINMVYPTGQAWTTPNEIGSCEGLEGSTVFPSGANFNPGSCSSQPRPVLYSQGTRAVVEITAAANPAACTGVDLKGNKTPGGAPFVCTGLCSDPNLDPTALSPKGIPCQKCLDPSYDPTTTPPCTTRLTH